MEPLELARVEEANFFEDLERLGCREPTLVLRVSEHIEDIVQFTQEVVEQGYGYTTTDGSVWFDVAKLGSSYGAFAEGRGTSTAAAQAAALVAEDPASASDAKRDQRDFALWKAVWKSKFYGASSSTPSTRRLLDGVAMPVPRRSTQPARTRHRREMT